MSIQRSISDSNQQSAPGVGVASLIERLEKATGPDRELDLAIQVALEPDGNIAHVTLEYPRGLNHQEGYAWDIYQKSVIYEKWTVDGRCPVNGGYPLPEYTSSIDSAVTLLPDNVYWMAAYGKRSPEEPLGACAIYHPGVDKPFIQVEGHTVAIALCIAALRARTLSESSS